MKMIKLGVSVGRLSGDYIGTGAAVGDTRGTRVCQRAAHLHLVVLGEAHEVRVLHGQQVLHLRLTNPWIWSQDSGIPGTDRIAGTSLFGSRIHWDLKFRAAARSLSVC